MLETLIAFTILINTARAVPLVPDAALSNQAQARAELICSKGVLTHTGWDKSFSHIRETSYIAENLAYGFPTVAAAHNALMASPTHKANIVSTNHTKVGIGTACGVTVQLFTGPYR